MSFLQLLRKVLQILDLDQWEKKSSPSKNRSKKLFLLIWLPFKESEPSQCA